MYTAEIKNTTIENGDLVVTVYYRDGANLATDTFKASSLAEINRKIRNKVETLDANLSLKASLVLGAYTPVAEATAPQAENDKNLWFRNFNRLEQLTRLNNLGALRAALVADLDALKATVSADFKKTYIADM
mgnify:CR=1 FL=1